MLQVEPVRTRGDIWNFTVPSSKPETQRAFLVAALAQGTSIVQNDLRCGETRRMTRALEAVGARFLSNGDTTAVQAIPRDATPAQTVPVIDCGGSALVCRVFRVLGCVLPGPIILTGDDILRRRELQELCETLDRANRPAEYLCEPFRLPLVMRGGGLQAGRYHVPGNVSSQFATALLVAAPLAEGPITIAVGGGVLSASYIRQTIAAMRMAGVDVEHDDALTELRVRPGAYQPFSTRLFGDYTSASYGLAAAALFEGRTRFRNLRPDSLQGERAMVRVLEALGVQCLFDLETNSLVVENRHGRLQGDFEFDAGDCPNIVPTLAALGSFVEGRFRVKNASITSRHKSPRILAMASELRKLGVDITVHETHQRIDGFEIRGRHTYAGGQTLSAWRDHRIFMSLFVASLRMRRPNILDGHEMVADSFPGFLEQFAANGCRFGTSDGATAPAERQAYASTGS